MARTFLALILCAGCGKNVERPPEADASAADGSVASDAGPGPDATGGADASTAGGVDAATTGSADAGSTADAGPTADAGSTGSADAGSSTDAGPSADAGGPVVGEVIECTGPGWQHVDIPASSAEYVAFALGADDVPRVAWTDSSSNVHVAVGAGRNTWTADSYYPGSNLDRTLAAAVASSGAARVAFQGTAVNGLWLLAAGPTSPWSTTSVDGSYDVGRELAYRIAPDGADHVVYWDAWIGHLKWATDATGEWVDDVVDASGATGRGPSLAIDSSGALHVAYINSSTRTLSYASKPAGGPWSVTPLEPLGDMGITHGPTSVGVDSTGTVHIAYRRESDGTLRHGTLSPGGDWTSAELTTVGTDPGAGVSLAVDGDDGIHIAYLDGVTVDAEYLYQPAGGDWTTETIDWMGQTGRWISLALDSAGQPHVAYRGPGGQARYARRCP